VSGEAEGLHVLTSQSRSEVIDRLTREATERAIAAGAAEASITTVDVEEIDIPYMANETTRISVRVVGDLLLGAD
jgi:6,7-dimethyl-8-ribityllumazine synthase